MSKRKKKGPEPRKQTDWTQFGLNETLVRLVKEAKSNEEIIKVLKRHFSVPNLMKGGLQNQINKLRKAGMLPPAKLGAGGGQGRKANRISLEQYMLEQQKKWYNPKHNEAAEVFSLSPLEMARTALRAEGRLTHFRGVECLDGEQTTIQQIMREGREAVLRAGGVWEGGRPERW